MATPTSEEQLEIIESHWYREATGFKAAGMAIRASLDGEQRMKAVSERRQHLEATDALSDAYNDIRAELGSVCTSGVLETVLLPEAKAL